MARLKYMKNSSGEIPLDGLLSDLKDVGGNPECLLPLLEACDMHPIFFIPYTDIKFNAKCVRTLSKASQIMIDSGFEESIADQLTLCAGIYKAFITMKRRLRGHPVNTRYYYWAGALLPYMKLKTGSERWRWLERWITEVEHLKTDLAYSLRISIPRGTGFLKKNEYIKYNRQQALIVNSLRIGILYGMSTIGKPVVESERENLLAEIEKKIAEMHTRRIQKKQCDMMRTLYRFSHNKPPKVDETPAGIIAERLLDGFRPQEQAVLPAKINEIQLDYYKTAVAMWPGIKSHVDAFMDKWHMKF